MMNKLRSRFGYLLLIAILTGCSSLIPNAVSSSIAVSPQSSATLDSTPRQSTETIAPTPNKTNTPGPTFTPTIPLPPPTFTPLPTLSTEDAAALILDLVHTHDNCRLPCLLGMSPGFTDFQTAEAFMKQFQQTLTPNIEITTRNVEIGGGVDLAYKMDNVFITISFSYARNNSGDMVDMLYFHSYPLEIFEPEAIGMTPSLAPVWGDPTFNQEMQDYMLPAILSEYGLPAEVMITVRPQDPERPDIKYTAFSLALYYPEQGIFVEYVSPVEERGKYYAGCPTKAHINLAVWDPESENTLEEVIKKAGSEIIYDYFKTLEEATELTMDDFYEKFSDPENIACLETPADIWLQP